jgi:hypothetical protein
MIWRVWLPMMSAGFLLSTLVWSAPASPHPSSLFDFHCGFWMNLHHFIYADASSSLPPQKAEDYPGYVPYAQQRGLWERAWPEPIRSLIIQDWKPHLQGDATLNGAVTQLVIDLASVR